MRPAASIARSEYSKLVIASSGILRGQVVGRGRFEIDGEFVVQTKRSPAEKLGSWLPTTRIKVRPRKMVSREPKPDAILRPGVLTIWEPLEARHAHDMAAMSD